MNITHVAIIMDGNGRWAKKRNKNRTYGHKHGAENIKNVIGFAIEKNIKYLTLFAFSCENWNRPKLEVNFLMKLLENYLNDKLVTYLNNNGICFKWIGFENKLKSSLINKIKSIEQSTKNNKKLILNIAFNYGGMQDILNAAKNCPKNQLTLDDFSKYLLTKNTPNVDLLIRTGNEKRISNFLLWQSAYAEIIFEPTLWPDYNKNIFENNILEYCSRQRRFGKI